MGYEIVLSPLIGERLQIVVLGRLDFLVHFRLTVEQAEQTFTLEASDELVSRVAVASPTGGSSAVT